MADLWAWVTSVFWVELSLTVVIVVAVVVSVVVVVAVVVSVITLWVILDIVVDVSWVVSAVVVIFLGVEVVVSREIISFDTFSAVVVVVSGSGEAEVVCDDVDSTGVVVDVSAISSAGIVDVVVVVVVVVASLGVVVSVIPRDVVV